MLIGICLCASTFTAQAQSSKPPQAKPNDRPQAKLNDRPKAKSNALARSFRVDARTSPRGVVVGAAFFAPSPDSKSDTVAALILRKSAGEQDFKQIARIERAATLEAAKARVFATPLGQQAWDFFTQTAGANTKERAEEQVWQALKDQPQRAVAALFLPYPSVGEALGLMYTDTTALALSAGTELTYAVRYVLRAGTTVPVEPVSGVRVVLGQPLRSVPPRLQDIYEIDSLIALRFASPRAGEQQLRIAALFRQIDGVGAFEQLPLFVTPSVRNDSLLMSFEDRVEPEHIIRYYAQMQDGAGNMGARSDTATVVSVNQVRVQRITQASARDTTNGIFLRWKPLAAKPYFLGVEILRAVGADGAYMPLDTVSLHDSTYLDISVQSGREYFYSWRAIMLRPSPEVPLVWASAAHRNKTLAPLAPYILDGKWQESADKQRQTGVSLTWQPSAAKAEQDVSHYLVYRAPVGKPLTVISKPLDPATTTYLDTDSTLDGRTMYSYAVRAVNFTGLESPNSHLIRIRPEKSFAPQPPASVGVYEDAGVVNIRWSAGANENESVVGFAVYRRAVHSSSSKTSATTDWTRLAQVSAMTTFLRDTTVQEGDLYDYTVSAYDSWGNESAKSAAFRFALAAPEITPPSRIYARSVERGSERGVEVSWSEQVRNGIAEIVIYRRSEQESTMTKLARIKPQETSFFDTTTKRDALYIYSLRVIALNKRESLPSREISIRP
jgi:hypothetical protein